MEGKFFPISLPLIFTPYYAGLCGQMSPYFNDRCYQTGHFGKFVSLLTRGVTNVIVDVQCRPIGECPHQILRVFITERPVYI